MALTAVATVTTTLRVGTGITLVAQHDPLWLAKQVATLDVISGGRFELGIGYGWNKEELRHHGVAYGERRAVLREKVLAMRALWMDDEASFHGEHVAFDASWAWPKPVQEPHPPIVMGGGIGPKTFAHIIEFCDGWMPLHGRYDVGAGMVRLRRAAEEAGRDPASIDIGVFQAPPKPERIEELRAAGVSRALFGLPQTSRDDARAALDEYAGLVERFGA